MFATLLTITLTAPAAEPPSPLPDRWLLKLAPADLPKLPEAFSKTTWFDSFIPRSLRGAWEEWTSFAPATDKKAGEVTVIHRGSVRDRRSENATEVTSRVSPLAVHGPLVEFDRKLYTVALTERKTAEGKTIKHLNLGAAVEVKPNVWYQAYSEDFTDGKVRVTEILTEFVADPRKEKEGKAKVKLFVRMLTEREGELTEYDGEFVPAKGRYGPAVRVWGKLKDGGAKNVWLELPYEEMPARYNMAPFKHLSVAYGDAPTTPKMIPPASFVQPPAKP